MRFALSDATISGINLLNFRLKSRYLTPNTNPTETICRVLRIPNDLRIICAVNEVLAVLGNPDVWEYSGGVGEIDTINLIGKMLDGYFAGTACMIGAIVPIARDVPDDGMLICDGQTYLRVDYPLLYDVLDSAFIVDANNFKTPDLRARVVIGENLAGDNYEPAFEVRELNQHGGAETHVLTDNELASHNHTAEPHGHSLVAAAGSFTPLFEGEIPAGFSPVDQPIFTDNTDISIHNAGNDQPHNNMPPFRVLKYAIIAR